MESERFKIEIYPLRERLLRYALQLVGDGADAEDAVQEALLKLWGMGHKIDEYKSVEALAMRVTHNVCIDLIRSRKMQTVLSDEATTEFAWDSPEKLLEESDTMKLMERIIERLPYLQRTILKMKDIEGYENDEIASITGCGVGAVRRNLSRARTGVRDTYLRIVAMKRND